MYLVKILNADLHPVDVEVSVEVYRVYEESWKQEEHTKFVYIWLILDILLREILFTGSKR